MNWFLVVGENAKVPPLAYPSLEVAEAFRHIKQFEYPTLGPWEVVHVAEVKQSNPITTDEE